MSTGRIFVSVVLPLRCCNQINMVIPSLIAINSVKNLYFAAGSAIYRFRVKRWKNLACVPIMKLKYWLTVLNLFCLHGNSLTNVTFLLSFTLFITMRDLQPIKLYDNHLRRRYLLLVGCTQWTIWINWCRKCSCRVCFALTGGWHQPTIDKLCQKFQMLGSGNPFETMVQAKPFPEYQRKGLFESFEMVSNEAIGKTNTLSHLRNFHFAESCLLQYHHT